ncbi:NYN domain-containing protein [Herbiconiux sp. L3-i23]|uniref:NYN domain-containing protein n=1 Tax=Herbiconiux sp. L3-i23 TaxID=2905871 RepID=UPI0020587513|nr:NYN domain-containing protein [Herbiconiux sp. L3-i23]BDI22882.1 hypothetical protein L3i23_16580 [Herbiconiux sp. L3-i23]
MAEAQPEARVGVYIDFDNIVISRYDEVHGDGSWRSDNARSVSPVPSGATPTGIAAKLARARIDVGAVLDYASSFGTIAHSRAYADWSVPANAGYRDQLVERAVDLTQLFPTTRGLKNGADIRLAVDVLEDLFRLPDLTHIVIVAGDSDYIPLAQRTKRLGRYVVGVGVSGKTSKALVAACDRFQMYDAIPGTTVVDDSREPDRTGSRAKGEPSITEAPAEQAAPTATGDRAASRLLVRALELGQEKSDDDDEWQNAAGVKSLMKRMDPAFNERVLGYKTFTDFVKSRSNLAEVKVDGQQRMVRLR